MKEEELENREVVGLKTLEGILSFILEDFVEIGLQYFYFEKYQFANDLLTYINAGFMVVKGFELAVRGVMVSKETMSAQESF